MYVVCDVYAMSDLGACVYSWLVLVTALMGVLIGIWGGEQEGEERREGEEERREGKGEERKGRGEGWIGEKARRGGIGRRRRRGMKERRGEGRYNGRYRVGMEYVWSRDGVVMEETDMEVSGVGWFFAWKGEVSAKVKSK